MNARVERGLALIFVAAIAGVAACTSGPAEQRKPAPGGGATPGGTAKPGEKPGTPTGRGRHGREATNVECLGPSNLSTAAREQLANQICSADMSRTARIAVENRCANVITGRSDAQIAGLLSTWSNALSREAASAENDASDPAVRDLAHLLHVGADRLRSENADALRRSSIRAQQTNESRSFGSNLQTEYGAIAKGATFDREFVARQVEEQHRALMLIDALVGGGKQASQVTQMHCEIEAARLMAETALDQTCWVWSSMGNVTGPRVAGRSRGQAAPAGQEQPSGQAAPSGQEQPSGQAAPSGQEQPSGQETQATPSGQETPSGQGTQAPAGQGTQAPAGQGTTDPGCEHEQQAGAQAADP
jgi:hypothetical protein